MYISRERLEDIMNENEYFKKSRCMEYKVRLKSGEGSNDFDDKVMHILNKEIQGINDAVNMGLNGEKMKGGDAIMSNVSMAIILIFSSLLIFVSLIIIHFSIRNSMELNLKNMGVLQAAGYIIRSIRVSCVLEMGIIAVFGIFAGNIIGLLISDIIGNFQGIMIGISWNQGFNFKISAFTSFVIFIIIIIVCWVSSAVYKKVTVLDALRGGINTHNFKKNYFPFEKSRLPYSMVMVGKNIMGEKIKNLSVLFIMIILSFASCVGFNLYQSFVLSTDSMLKIIGIEMGDIHLQGNDLERISEEIKNWEEIDKVLCCSNLNVKLDNGKDKQSVFAYVWDDPAGLERETVIRGHLPQFNNEIVITTAVAEALNVDVGDVVYAECEGKRIDYLISGIDQKTNNMGLTALLTMESAGRLVGNIQESNVDIYTHEGVAFEEIQNKILENYPEAVVVNGEKIIEEATSSVKIGMSAICIIFVAITIFVVAMVEVLLVSTKIVRERKIYGINKALGYTTGRLVLQTVINNLPVMAAGSVLGAVLSSYLMNPLTVMVFSYCKMEKISLPINPLWMVVTVIGITVLAALFSFLSSLRIVRIEPVKMLSEE